MEPQSPVDSIRYLEAKRSVDDRALNQRVWSTVWQELQAEAPRILELGCGIGTMIERVLQARPLPSADYTAVDLNPSFLDEARRRLRTWGQKHGFQVRQVDQVLILAGDGISLSVRFQQADITDNLRGAVSAGWDLLMANAVLDLVDLRTAVPALLDLLKPGGMFYFTINFDGVTSFQPQGEPDLDRRVVQLYHQTMDERHGSEQPVGGSRSGRHLLSLLQQHGSTLLAAGGSDWIVHPRAGSYDAQEGDFLRMLLDTIEYALRGRTELPDDELDRWLDLRRQQLARAELIFLAHQLDVCGRA